MAKTLTAPPLPEFPVETNGAHQTDPQWDPAWEATPEPMPHPLSSLPLLPPHAPEPTPEVLLSEKALCLALSLSKPGNHRKLSASLVEVDADKELISAQKKLLSSEHLKTIEHYDGEIRRFLYNTCLPSLFKEGIYLVPIVLIKEVDAKLTAFDDKRKHLVAAFLEVYPVLIEDAKTRLRAAFSQNDYPPVERVERAFRMDWRFVAFSVPGTLQTVSQELFRKEQDKAANAWTETLEEVRTLLRTHLSELVQHMVERLSGTGKDGKPKVFKNTLVTNMTVFLNAFDARNLTDDTELAAIVTQARELLNGVDAQTLRTSQALRNSLRDGFCTLQGTLDTLVISRPARAFSFADE